MGASLVETVARLPQKQRRAIVRRFPEVLDTWRARARSEQLPPPGEWVEWLFLGGRGTGKTRAGAEWILERVRSGKARHVALIGATAADVRDVMVEGVSGIMRCARNREARYFPARRRVEFSNGAIALCFSAEEPDRLRGPQHDTIWGDEIAAWPDAEHVRAMALMGLRLGADPRACWTTTPRPWLRVLADDPRVVMTRASTFANRGYLAASFLDEMLDRYAGTTLGRQELNAEILEEGGDVFKVGELLVVEPPMERLTGARAWDLAASTSEDADMTATVRAAMHDDRLLILDAQAGRWSPGEVEARMRATADLDGPNVLIGVEREPGASGWAIIDHLKRDVLPDRVVVPLEPSGSKEMRALLLAGLVEQGRVALVRGDWNRALIDALERFPCARRGCHDDLVDAAAYAARMVMRPSVPAGSAVRVRGVLR